MTAGKEHKETQPIFKPWKVENSAEVEHAVKDSKGVEKYGMEIGPRKDSKVSSNEWVREGTSNKQSSDGASWSDDNKTDRVSTGNVVYPRCGYH